MRACLYDHTGPAREVLRVEEVERPEPGPGQVRAKVSLSGVNPTDVKSRAGLTPRPIEGFQIPHQDGTGVIDAVGPGVDERRIGERVWLWMAAVGKWGTGAEWTVVPSEQAVPLPSGASDELGACLGVPAMTAHWCLFSDGGLADRSVLVAGGAGAVGHYAIELARRGGARVATTVSGPEKARLAEAAGADLVVNYHDADALDRLKRFAPTMDRVVEVNLPANLDLDLALAGPSTTIVTYAAAPDDPTLPTRRCMNANVSFRFVLLYGVPRDALIRAAADITDAVEAGDLSPLPTRAFPLSGSVEAHEAVEQGVVGKVVVAPAE